MSLSPTLWKLLSTHFFWISSYFAHCDRLILMLVKYGYILKRAFPEFDLQRVPKWIPITYLGRPSDSTPGLSMGAPWLTLPSQDKALTDALFNHSLSHWWGGPGKLWLASKSPRLGRSQLQHKVPRGQMQTFTLTINGITVKELLILKTSGHNVQLYARHLFPSGLPPHH